MPRRALQVLPRRRLPGDASATRRQGSFLCSSPPSPPVFFQEASAPREGPLKCRRNVVFERQGSPSNVAAASRLRASCWPVHDGTD